MVQKCQYTKLYMMLRLFWLSYYAFGIAHVRCPSYSTRVWRHRVGASRPNDDSVAEENEEDAARLFRVLHHAFFMAGKGPTGPPNGQGRETARVRLDLDRSRVHPLDLITSQWAVTSMVFLIWSLWLRNSR